MTRRATDLRRHSTSQCAAPMPMVMSSQVSHQMPTDSDPGSYLWKLNPSRILQPTVRFPSLYREGWKSKRYQTPYYRGPPATLNSLTTFSHKMRSYRPQRNRTRGRTRPTRQSQRVAMERTVSNNIAMFEADMDHGPRQRGSPSFNLAERMALRSSEVTTINTLREVDIWESSWRKTVHTGRQSKAGAERDVADLLLNHSCRNDYGYTLAVLAFRFRSI
jgi:hypothetical protein